MAIQIIDITGQVKDWTWLQQTYGPVTIEEPGVIGAYYKVTMLQEVEGIMGFCLSLRDAGGLPVAGTRVVYSWPGADEIVNSGWDGCGVVEVTNTIGTAEHTAGGGEGYVPPNKGPVSWWVYGEPECSQKISGLGWLGFTNHRHLQVTMQMTGVDPGPGPDPGTFEAAVLVYLKEIRDLLKAERRLVV